MANEINIDSLSIEIKSNADKATSAIDSLAKTLERLQDSVSKVTGLTRLTKHLEKLNQVVSSFQTPQLANITNQLEKISKIVPPDFSKTASSLNKITKSLTGIENIGDVSGLSTKINEVVSAVKPLENLGKNTLAPFISSMRAIPKLTESIDNSTLASFRSLIQQIVTAITPLANRVNQSERGLVALNGILQSTIRSNGNLASSNASLVKSYTSLGSVITSFKAKIVGSLLVFRRLGRVLGSALQQSNAYVENLNLFTVTMGEAADEAYRFAEEVNNALGIDISDWIRNQGVFKQIVSGFGVVTEKANLMSKNLTQVGYDISSFFNINIDEAMRKVQSGISGELEPLRRLGYALDAATLQQIAYDNGIQQNINTMTQAQKSQLRYVAILKQSANVMGDMARTVTTPANSMRILNQQITQFQRAVGNIVSVLAVKLIPYIQVAIRLLTDLANYLADLWGFELPEIDYSGMEDGITGLSDDADEATEAVDNTVKAVQRLAGFDEINVLKSAKEDADDTVDSLTNNFDLGIDLPEYDFLQGVENATEELYQKAKKWLKEIYEWWKKHKEIIKIVAGLLTALWVTNKITPFVSAIKNLFGALKSIANLSGFGAATGFIGTLKSVLTGGVFGVSSGLFSFDFFKNLVTGTLDWKTGLIDTLGVLGSIGAAFALGGPIAGGIAIFGALIGAVAGLNYELGKTFDEAMIQLFDNGGVKITEITDLFEDQYKQVDDTAQEVKTYLDTITGNNKKISDAQEEIKLLSEAIEATNGAMTEEQAKQIKENFEIIGQGIKSNIGLATQGILTSFSDTISRTANTIGVDLSNVIADIQGFEKTLTGNVDKAQEVINNYTDKLLSGATPTKQETEAYENAWNYFMEKARETSEYTQFQQEMNIDFSKIDFQDEAVFEEQMQRLTDAAKKAQESVESTYQDAISLVSAQENEANKQYRYGMLDYETYTAMTKQFNNVRRLLNADRNKQIEEIKYNYSAITGAMQSQVNAQIKDQAELLAAQEHWVRLGLKEMPETMSDSLRDAIAEFKRTQHKEWDGTIKDGEKLWQEWYSSQVNTAKQNMHHLDEKIDDFAAQIDILPNPNAGKKWLQSMANNSKAELPSTLAEMDYIMGQIRDEIDKEGKTAYMPSADVEKLVKERYYALGESQKQQYLSGFDVNGIQNAIYNGLSFGLYGAGEETAESWLRGYMSTMATGLEESLNAAANIFSLVPGMETASALLRNFNVSSFFRFYGYAQGGMPRSGELFFANENGKAEFISSVGNRVAVANQQQMRSEIRAGVREGMVEALRSQSNGNGDVYVFIDSDQIAYKMERRSAQRSKMNGGR